MPESLLPDDVNRWPQDPYQLLGVTSAAPAKEVRKAYTRLVRQYKPEQFPEQFRRIRDAFESIQRYGIFYQHFPAAGQSEPDAELPAPAEEDRAPLDPGWSNLEIGSPPNVEMAPWRRLPRPDDALARFWDRACQGEELEAYRGFREFAERPGNQEEIFLRLYWLLRTAPEVDIGRSPCDWLVRGLRGGGWNGPCRELYHREIEHRPAEAVSERFTQLLETQAPVHILSEWLGWRWHAAGRLGKWACMARRKKTATYYDRKNVKTPQNA